MYPRNEARHGKDDSIVASCCIVTQMNQWALADSAAFIFQFFDDFGGDCVVARETTVLSWVELSGVDAVLDQRAPFNGKEKVVIMLV